MTAGPGPRRGAVPGARRPPGTTPPPAATGGFDEAARRLYQEERTAAHVSKMLAVRHRTNMVVINNIGSSNTRYEPRRVYRYR